MTQDITSLVEHARAQGVAFYQGKIASGNTFESARVLAIVPAIKAIEAGTVTLTSDLPGEITRAYADGAKIEYSGNSLKSAVSKTFSFLKAAEAGVCMALFNAVHDIIRGTNDAKAQKVMQTGIFEKLHPLCAKAAAGKAVPDNNVIIAALTGANVKPNNEELLASLFGKMAKLAKNIADIESEKYAALDTERCRYERLAGEHKARAARIAEQEGKGKAVASTAIPVAPVASVAPALASPAGTDNVAAPDIVDNLLDLPSEDDEIKLAAD